MLVFKDKTEVIDKVVININQCNINLRNFNYKTINIYIPRNISNC